MRTIRAEPVTIAPVSRYGCFTASKTLTNWADRTPLIVHRWPYDTKDIEQELREAFRVVNHLLMDPVKWPNHWRIIQQAVEDGRFVDHVEPA